MSGYSPRPLADKLGLKPGMRAWFGAMPAAIRAELSPQIDTLTEQNMPTAGLELGHIFVTERAVLARELPLLRECLAPAGFLWVSWPKRASGVASDVSEDGVRAVALPLGLVDVKVCAVDAVWSGLKLMIRRELR